ncbi:MAG: lipoyl(octanoyl) transferase LipB [Beutenbergiaceae bacterium]
MDVEYLGFAPDFADYRQAWARQREVHGQVADGERPDTVLLCEHASVFTAGARTLPKERPIDDSEVIAVDRGGKITWHGPGQLVGYPIVRLPDPVDVVAHVRRLEDLMMAVCTELGLDTVRIEGRSGVWRPGDGERPDRKVGAIGVRVSRGVTMHGFAFNADCDLSWAKVIVPCGLEDATATSLTAELDRHITVADLLPLVQARLPMVLATSAV